MPALSDRIVLPAATLAGAGVAWLLNPYGAANYDTLYALVWGADAAHGRVPDYEVPVSPTPHPLAELVGLVSAPLGAGAETVAVVLAYLSLGFLAAVVLCLGRRAFGVWAGVVAAAIVITRVPVLSFGVRAYVDIPYCALVLAAVLAEGRRSPRTVLALLAAAGLLRPEAWLFSFAYVAWRREWRLLWLAASAPALWALSDLVVTGNLLHSLSDTQEGARELERRTGLDDVVTTAPRRLGEILREPVLVGAAIGAVLGLWRLRERSLPLAVVGIAAGLAFCVLAAFGLPILGRYLLLPACVLALFCGLAVAGPAHVGGPWPKVAAGLVLVLLVAFAPAQADRLGDLRGALRIQKEIRDDLAAILDAAPAGCRPVAVPNHRPVPLVALRLDIPAREVVSAQLERPDRGLYLDPANERVERNYTLDPNDPARLTAEVPDGFARLGANPSWVLYGRC